MDKTETNNKKGFLNKIGNFSMLIALLILICLFYILQPRFLSERNIYNIVLQVSILAPISIGMTMVILTGGIDLSVGSVLAFSQAVCAGLLLGGTNILLCCLVAIVIGTFLGLVNGLFIVGLRLPPFIATLGMMSIARGLQMTWTLGATLYSFPKAFSYLGTAHWFGVPAPIYLVIAVFIIFHFIMKYTILGRSIYAIGGNPQAARISGISINKVTIMVYTVCGLMVALGGLLQLMRLDAHESSAGNGMELEAIACVVIGGTSMAGGSGSILKTALGTLVYGVIINGLNIVGVNPFIQKTVIGLLIVFAVAVNTNLGRLGKQKRKIKD
jgi:ribose transport system permease protein